MKSQLRVHLRLIILTGIAVGLTALLYIVDPLHKLGSEPATHSADHSQMSNDQVSTEPPKPKLWEFPGGGRELLPKYRLVALYGNPEARVLGSFGEQPPEEAIARVKNLAAEYQSHSAEPIYPAFEIITTVASAGPGDDGNYSRETPVDTLRPIVELAKTHGVYILLDLQPGHSDFLSQAKMYETLLKEPHVGLAIDPEWRLKPGQKHMKQIGTVTAAEINQTAAWLADLTKQYELPQKLLLLHQFKLSMITERDTLDTSRPELAWCIQMDGLGVQPVKQDTWRIIRTNAPANVYFGWKNFIDEDKPMLSPDQTMSQVEPKPFFVSYQ